MLYTAWADTKSPSFSLSTEVPWLTTVTQLGQSPGFTWPMQPKTGNMALSRLYMVAGWRIGREVEEKGWYKSPCSPATTRAPRGGVFALPSTLHMDKALPSHRSTSHCCQTCTIQNPHRESTRNIHNLFSFSLLKELQI